MKLLLKNGRLIDPSTKTDETLDILIENGKIKKISALIKKGSTNTKTIDIAGCIVSPGFIDLHVHLREPGQEHKETIESGAKAAAWGGFTSIICMPNTSPVNDNPLVTDYIVQTAKKKAVVNVFPVAAISQNLRGEKATDMHSLVNHGVVGFSDDGCCVMNGTIFHQALESAKKLDVPVIEHPEDHSISDGGQINQGPTAKKYGLKGIPNSAEDVIVARDIIIQEQVRSRLHLTHISTSGSVALIRQAKKEKIPVTADVTPHHLLLTDRLITPEQSVYKVNPPLRKEPDRQALIKGLVDGSIDCIATDHAPHSIQEKARPFPSAPFGLIGLETAFSVVYDKLVRTGIIDIYRMIELFSCNPAKIINLPERGTIKPELPADLTIINPEKRFSIDPRKFQSKARNCPFKGWQGKGVIEYTVVNGKIVYDRKADN